MQLVTVGTKYQVVIPKEVRKKLKIKPGDKVAIGAKNEETAILKTNPKSWVQKTSGMMKDAWKDIDPIVELEKMRDEWER